MFYFVNFHLFSAGGRHLSNFAELPCLIDITQELHTKVQGMILSTNISTTLMYNVLRLWSQYLNRCVAASASEVVESPGVSVPNCIEPILVNLEGGALRGKKSIGTPNIPHCR